MRSSIRMDLYPRSSWGRRRGLAAVLLAGVTVVLLAGLPGGSIAAVPVAGAQTHGDKAAGAALFHERGCEHCHGADGKGGDLGPDLSGVGKRRSKAEIERQIREGGGGMPAFGEALQTGEIQDLVEYLHAKQKAGVPAPPTLPSASQ